VVADAQKTDLLLELLKRVNYDSVIVFCRTKYGADRISHMLKRNNHAVAVLHSNRTQREREQALRGFRDGRFEVLVATDIAARGLDIADVSHVINYDVPQHPEDYIHRIGRTGRMEATGDAFTLMVAEDRRHVEAIERFISQKIPRIKLEGFDYRYTALFEEEKPGAAKGFDRRVTGARVRGGYAARDLQRDIDGPWQWQDLLAIEQASQIRPFEQLHDVVAVPVVVLHEVADLDDVLVIDQIDRARLGEEALHRLDVARVLGAQDLDRDLPPELGVLGDEHPAHPALADLLQQTVRPEHGVHLDATTHVASVPQRRTARGAESGPRRGVGTAAPTRGLHRAWLHRRLQRFGSQSVAHCFAFSTIS